jgi:anaerobic selenocysteine-containing dehydrogenase
MAVCGKLLVSGGNIVHDAFKYRGPTIHEEDPNVWRTVATGKFPVNGAYPAGALSTEILSDHPERLRALLISRANPVRTYPDSNAMEAACKKLDLLVCIDVCETETGRLADYMLPGKTGYEAYEFTLFQATYPEVTCQLKHPVLEQTAERKEDAEIWIEIAKAMGTIPQLPESLYRAAEKAVAANDRMSYFLVLFQYVNKHKQYFPLMPLIIAATMGKAMGSAAKSMLWAALLTSHLSTTGIIERAGYTLNDRRKPLSFYRRVRLKILQKSPKLRPLILMDNVFQAVDDTPQGVVIGISSRETCLPDHIFHEDKKLHFYCDEINDYIQRITPEKEKAELQKDPQFPMILSSGRHSDDGHNATMRNPDTYKYRRPYTLAINPEDAVELGIQDGQSVRVTTNAGSLLVPVEYSWQTSRGYTLIPHHFGFQFNGKQNGCGANMVTANYDMDELTGNPTLRYVPCLIEAVAEGVI